MVGFTRIAAPGGQACTQAWSLYPAQRSHLMAICLRISSYASSGLEVPSGPEAIILFPLTATGAADVVCAIGNDLRIRSLPAPLVKKVLKRFQEETLASAGSSTFTIEMAP